MPFLTDYPQLQTIQAIAKKKKVNVYLVGGFLRDYLLGRPQMDFDFAVEKGGIAFARAFADHIKGAFVLLDQEHGCARVVKKIHGVPQTFDFADYRAANLKSDLSHRDFTVNTLTVHINKLSADNEIPDAILDFKNGKADLKKKVIRMVAAKTFQEDPLRLLRAYSLRAQTAFKIEPKTLSQIKKDKDLIRDVSAERVRDELFKILESPRAVENLIDMDKIGLLEKIMPQITVMYDVKQGGYHHLDVWPHSLEAVRQLEGVFNEFRDNPDVTAYVNESLAGPRTRRGLMKLAALLHDIGKPETKKIEQNKVSFHAHEHVGRGIVKSIAKALKLSGQESQILKDIVLWHLRPGYLSNFKNPSEKSIFRYFRDTKDEAASILLLSLADQRSTRGPLTTEADQKHHEKICYRLIQKYFDKKKEKPFVRLIDGNDLIKKLKLKPSPLFGKILSKVEEHQTLGKIKTKEDALKLAQGMIAKGAKP